MAYELFTIDTFTGRRTVAIKARKDSLPGDNRSDAYSVAISNWGVAVRVIGEGKSARRLPADFNACSTAPGWGFWA